METAGIILILIIIIIIISFGGAFQVTQGHLTIK